MFWLINNLDKIPDGVIMAINGTMLFTSFGFLSWVILTWKRPQWGRWKRIGLAGAGAGGGFLVLLITVAGLGKLF